MGFLSKRLSELQTKYRKRYKRIGFGLKTGVDLERYLIYFLKGVRLFGVRENEKIIDMVTIKILCI
jgi:hypothetical protein